jgi:NnrU protein
MRGALKAKSMASILMAAVFFDGIHFFVAGTGLRAKIVGKIGEEAFQSLFSVLSLIGIFWLSRAYGRAGFQALRPAALVVMAFAFFFVVPALTRPNPTAVRGSTLLKEKEPGTRSRIDRFVEIVRRQAARKRGFPV